MKIECFILFALTAILFTQSSNCQNPLTDYVLDNSDISVVSYTIQQVTNNQTFTVYTFNVTSLQWFNGKH